MHRTLLKAFIVFLVISQPALARAGFYLSAHVGGGRASDTTIDNSSGADHRISHDPGFDVGIAAGYSLPFFRMEAELNSRNGDAHRIDGENAREGDFTAYSAMANLYLDFDNPSLVTPFIGAGGGILRLSIDDLRSDSVSIGDESDSTEAWQMMAGVAVKLSPRTNLDLTYRYLDCKDLSWSGAKADYTVNSLVFGLRYSF
jgi:opacity protein-like surface antigen